MGLAYDAGYEPGENPGQQAQEETPEEMRRDGHRRGRILAELILAEVHVRTGDPRGLALAQQAITAASTLQSVVARRQRLVALAIALEARPESDAHELARMARQIAATRI